MFLRSSSRRRVMLAVLSVAGLAGLLPAGPALAGTAPSDSAWVVVRKPSRVSYTPAAADRSNSAGGAITVSKVDVAGWSVRIPNQGTEATDNGGHIQVTALGTTAAICASTGWGQDGTDIVATVSCGAPDGTPLVTPFVLGWVHEGYDAALLPTFGYAWLSAPENDTSTPNFLYQQDVAGGTITASRSEAGKHVLSFPNMDSMTYVGVTPYVALTRCRTEGWFSSLTDTSVYTACGGSTGVDTRLNVYVAVKTGPLGFGRVGATAWASDPTKPRYRPLASYRWSSSGKSPVITRTARGRYTVRFAGQEVGGAAFVTTYGAADRVCQVASIAKRGTAASVGVACFRSNGRPADSRFTIGWTR